MQPGKVVRLFEISHGSGTHSQGSYRGPRRVCKHANRIRKVALFSVAMLDPRWFVGRDITND